jgi:hypothetical protein
MECVNTFYMFFILFDMDIIYTIFNKKYKIIVINIRNIER